MIYLDFETRSKIDLVQAGLYRYAEDISTSVLCLAWAMDDENPELWIPGDPAPHRLFNSLHEHFLSAYNAEFEITIWREICVKRMGWPEIPDNKWCCTMIDALALGLPRSMEQCALALGTIDKKDTKGKNLIRKLSKPIAAGKKKGEFREKAEFHQDYLDLYSYCKQDVRTERAIRNSLPLQATLNFERQDWLNTLKMNRRGIPIDKLTASSILALSEQKIEKLDAEIMELTDEKISTARQREKIRCHLEDEFKLFVPDMQNTTVEKLLEGDLPEKAERILNIRRSINHPSVAKFKKIFVQLCKDSTIKGCYVHHGAGTGRYTAQGMQPQNFPRLSVLYEKVAIEMIQQDSLSDIELVMGDSLHLFSALLRANIKAPDGETFFNADLSQIEARMAAWIAKEYHILKAYADGLDAYRVTSADMYGVPYDVVTTEQRQGGKTTVLACLASGQKVLTDKGLIPIEKVCTCMRVWDGVSFVNHSGTIYQGVKKVINYGKLLATPDHIVYTEEGEKISLQEANRKSATIKTTGIGRRAIRMGENYRFTDSYEKERPTNKMSMYQLWIDKVDQLIQSSQRQNCWLPEVQPTEVGSEMAFEKVCGRKISMSKPTTPSLEKLWSTWHKVLFQFSCGYGSLDRIKSRITQRFRDRSYRQQRKLSSRKFEILQQAIKLLKQKRESSSTVPRISSEVSRCKVCGQHLTQFDMARVDRRRNSLSFLQQTELQTKRQVWDILNAGPRNRFTVEGKLVSNCGFGGGEKALDAMAQNYGLSFTKEKRIELVNAFRQARPGLVKSWESFGDAARKAMENPGYEVPVSTNQKFKFSQQGHWLFLHLPNNRRICFPFAQWIPWKTPWGQIKMSVTHRWMSSYTRKWERRSITGASLFQSAVQGLSRDVLMEAHRRLEQNGYKIVMTVHDELMAQIIDDASSNLDHFNRLFKQNPSWCPDLPIDSDPWRGERYKK
ncbi:MAG: DNA polymerase [Desulfobacteraceae bacterium]|jgi:DNA polymerase